MGLALIHSVKELKKHSLTKLIGHFATKLNLLLTKDTAITISTIIIEMAEVTIIIINSVLTHKSAIVILRRD